MGGAILNGNAIDEYFDLKVNFMTPLIATQTIF